MLISFAKKINVESPVCWDFHRSGWKYAVRGLHSLFHDQKGVYVSTHFETSVATETPIRIPWIGFLHNTPFHPKEMEYYGKFNKSLSDIVISDVWRASRPHCKGLFVLSEYARNWVSDNMFDKVCSLHHPTEFVNNLFDLESFLSRKRRTVVSIGHWMRRFGSFEALNCNLEKLMLVTPHHPSDRKSGVIYRSHVPNDKYDRILSQSLAFLDLFDSSANNAVIECIVRNTPILINRLPALEEYLGKDYPFFFENLAHAESLISDDSAISRTHDYLRTMDKSFLKIESFLRGFYESEVYGLLTPKPSHVRIAR